MTGQSGFRSPWPHLDGYKSPWRREENNIRIQLRGLIHVQFPCSWCNARRFNPCVDTVSSEINALGYEHAARQTDARRAGMLPIEDPTWWLENNAERIRSEILEAEGITESRNASD